MDTYSILRQFADSWFLIAMFVFFIGAAVFACWPSRKAVREDAAAIPFKEDAASCPKACADCVCKTTFSKEFHHG